MTYREEVRNVRKEVNWTFWKVLPLIIIIVVTLSAVGFGLRSVGLIGSTAVERVVFENSYQRSESLKSEIAMNEAQLIEITRQLSNPNLNENTRFNLEAQKSAINVRIATAKGKQ